MTVVVFVGTRLYRWTHAQLEAIAVELSIRDHWENVVTDAVRSGRFASAEDVVYEGLRLVEEREVRLSALRTRVAASIEDPRPSLTDDQVGEALAQRASTYPAPGDHA